MQPKPLTDRLSVTPQVQLADIAGLAAQGFRSLINNRPDGEAQAQPSSDALAAEAQRHGMTYRYIPIAPGLFTDADVASFGTTLAALPAPSIAFCRSGTRSTTLWALHAAATLDPQRVIEIAAGAGYDLSTMRSVLARRHGDAG